MNRRGIAAVLTALLIAAHGCSFDMIEVQELPREAGLTLLLDVRAHDGPLELSAGFHPGATAAGTRPIVDDSIRVNGIAIAPTEVRSNGQRVYRVIDLDASAAPLVVRPPPVAGLPDAPVELVIEAARVAAPDTIVVEPQGTLEIAIAGVTAAADTLTRGSWSVQLRLDDSPVSVFTLFGSTVPPSTIRIPSELLPAGPTRGHVQVRGTILQTIIGGTGSYDVDIRKSFDADVPIRFLE